MPVAGKQNIDHSKRLSQMNPAAADASLGPVIYDLVTEVNRLQVALAAALAKLDAAAVATVAALGTTNAAGYTPIVVKKPEER